MYRVFLGLRALAGIGWAMFGTVATTTMVDHPGSERRSAPPLVWRDWRFLGVIFRVAGVLLMSLTNAALMAVQTGVLVFLYPLYLVERGHLSPETVGSFVGLSVLGRLLALWLGGSVSDRWGRMSVMIPGLLTYSALLGSLTLITHPILLGLWSLMLGGGAGFVATLPTAIIGDRVSPPLQGIAIGRLRTVTDSGMILGPLVMGALADAMHLSAPFLFAGALLSAIAWRCYRTARRAPDGKVQEG